MLNHKKENQMASTEKIKDIVKNKYGEIAKKTKPDENCGCSCGCGPSAETDYSVFSDSYENLEGYVADADLGLGCGIPTQYANIKEGDIVIDLGSGAGNDVFVARSLVGESGKVIGIDMTQEMIDQANLNRSKLGYKNVEFRLGDIENMPLPDNQANVVISNCVLNLVPDKEKAFSEIHRILRPGAHFCISDVVIEGNLPVKLQKSAEMYAGCVAGALQKENYLKIIQETGFKDLSIKASKKIELPDDLLEEYLTLTEIEELRHSGLGIFSITVVGTK
jgi:ubiquinone/menaquinone biosynthesis C-methylase UbiE